MLVCLLFFLLIVFVTLKSIDGFKAYGWKIFGGTFDASENNISIWFPFCITIIISLLAILIASPLGITAAIFIKYRLPQRWQKIIRVFIEVLADIPSVIFGLFACAFIGPIIKFIFHFDNAYNLVTSGIMLSFMVLPTIISLSINSLDAVDPALLPSSMVLGISKTKSIYKVCVLEATPGIMVAVLIAISRAIGETMAVSTVLQGSSYQATFQTGFWHILDSGLLSLGGYIATNMFAEGGGPHLQSLLFGFGLFMFVFVMVLNAVAIIASKRKKQKKWSWWQKIENFVGAVIGFIPLQIKLLWRRITYKKPTDKKDIGSYAYQIKHNKTILFYAVWHQIWEWVSIIITLLFLGLIVGDILVLGLQAWFSADQTMFQFSNNSTGQAFVNTILLIIVAIGIGCPLSIAVAIYLCEFAKRDSKVKSTLLFFIDSLGATPSILFGMFGLIFFLQTLGFSSNGTSGKSLIAGALTILIVILPVFIRLVQQALDGVPNDMRVNAYALGVPKGKVITKIVLPVAAKSILTAVVLSIGRILAETAPLYLTSGLSSSNKISLIGPGQTLTTRIYSQILNNDYSAGNHIMYECALITIIFVLVLIIITNIVLPYYFKWRQEQSGRKDRQKLGKKNKKGSPPNISKVEHISLFLMEYNNSILYE